MANKVKVFDSVESLLDDFIKARYDLYIKRKERLLKTLKAELCRLVARYVFCKSVIDGSLVISNRSKADISADMEKIDKLIKVDGSFDWLLRMPIHSISMDTMSDLKSQILSKKDEFTKIRNTPEKVMWEEDLDKLNKAYFRSCK
jgi:DNA topoisomerase-2